MAPPNDRRIIEVEMPLTKISEKLSEKDQAASHRTINRVIASIDHRLAAGGQHLVFPTQAGVRGQPREHSLHHSAAGAAPQNPS